MAFDATTDPDLRSFVNVPADSDFPIQNLPYGVFRRSEAEAPRVGVAIGDHVLDLGVLEGLDLFTHPALRDTRPFARPSLNWFMALNREAWRSARETISRLLTGQNPTLVENSMLQAEALVRRDAVTLMLPVQVGDYTDFYSSLEHAQNVGTMFRGAENALMPNWRHLPVAYHGRSSSIVPSGTPIRRPAGQIKSQDGTPSLETTRRLDFELEMGIFVGRGNLLGEAIPISEAREYLFGMVLVNDWSARDIQQWEYVPLGPFLGKNFATTVSPWVVPLDALEPFRCSAPEQEPSPLPYLAELDRSTFDIHLSVSIQPRTAPTETVVARSNFRTLYWTLEQQLAHHTVNGCNMRPGDLLASGTISGSEPGTFGSLLELAWGGERLISLDDGTTRAFLEDGDRVQLRAWAQGEGYRVGFGVAEGTIVPTSGAI